MTTKDSLFYVFAGAMLGFSIALVLFNLGMLLSGQEPNPSELDADTKRLRAKCDALETKVFGRLRQLRAQEIRGGLFEQLAKSQFDGVHDVSDVLGASKGAKDDLLSRSPSLSAEDKLALEEGWAQFDQEVRAWIEAKNRQRPTNFSP